MFAKLWTLYNLAETDHISTIIWNFDTHQPESRNRRLNTDIFGLEGECKVFLKSFYLIEFYSFTRSQAVLSDCWSYLKSGHRNLYTKLEERSLDDSRLKLYFFTGEWLTFWMMGQ